MQKTSMAQVPPPSPSSQWHPLSSHGCFSFSFKGWLAVEPVATSSHFRSFTLKGSFNVRKGDLSPEPRSPRVSWRGRVGGPVIEQQQRRRSRSRSSSQFMACFLRLWKQIEQELKQELRESQEPKKQMVDACTGDSEPPSPSGDHPHGSGRLGRTPLEGASSVQEDRGRSAKIESPASRGESSEELGPELVALVNRRRSWKSESGKEERRRRSSNLESLPQFFQGQGQGGEVRRQEDHPQEDPSRRHQEQGEGEVRHQEDHSGRRHREHESSSGDGEKRMQGRQSEEQSRRHSPERSPGTGYPHPQEKWNRHPQEEGSGYPHVQEKWSQNRQEESDRHPQEQSGRHPHSQEQWLRGGAESTVQRRHPEDTRGESSGQGTSKGQGFVEGRHSPRNDPGGFHKQEQPELQDEPQGRDVRHNRLTVRLRKRSPSPPNLSRQDHHNPKQNRAKHERHNPEEDRPKHASSKRDDSEDVNEPAQQLSTSLQEQQQSHLVERRHSDESEGRSKPHLCINITTRKKDLRRQSSNSLILGTLIN